MDLLTAMRISASGLSAQRERINVISGNLSNAQTTRTLEGGPYRAKSIVFTTKPVEEEFGKVLAGTSGNHAQGVEVAGIVEDNESFKEVYDPNHPDADERGIVRMPNVNIIEEVVDMMATTRAYEANVTAIGASKTMALKTLDIGK